MFSRVLALAPGTVIPKPEATADFHLKGAGRRRGERAVIYTIPNHQGGRPYEKGITESELKLAASNLITSGEFTRDWFNENLAACAKEGGCNFTTIGGLLQLLGEAEYTARGTYRRPTT